MTTRTPLLVGLGLALLTLGCVAFPAIDKSENANATERGAVVSNEKTTAEKATGEKTMTATVEQAIAQIENVPQPSQPDAERSGDFSSRTGHLFWTVIDADSEGLNCRWSSDVPEEWYSPSADWPDEDFQNWSVVQSFDYGTVLTANITPAGFATIIDSRGLPWLKVRLGSGDQICLVRANASYILPIPYNTQY